MCPCLFFLKEITVFFQFKQVLFKQYFPFKQEFTLPDTLIKAKIYCITKCPEKKWKQFRFIINFRKKIRIESNSEERPAVDAPIKETPESSGPDEDNDLAERIKKKSRGRPKKSNEIVVNIYLFLKVTFFQKERFVYQISKSPK